MFCSRMGNGIPITCTATSQKWTGQPIHLAGSKNPLTLDMGSVKVTIPLQLASKEALQPSFEEDDFSCLEGKRILLAEDNDLNAEIAIELLKEKGMIIDRTKDGIECIDALTKKKSHTYVCILMDIQMPHMDGYEAAKSIRSLKDPSFSSIPIIAMTANAFKEDQNKAYASGMNDYIPKPIDIKNVCKTISKYVQE